MRIYYIGPLKKAEVFISENDVLREAYVVNKNGLFYKNSFGVLIRDKIDYPIVLSDEVEDYIDNYKKIVKSLQYSILYVDEKELEYIGKKPIEAVSQSIPEKVKTYIKTKFNKN